MLMGTQRTTEPSRCQGPWEVTPLQQAAFWGRADVAKILLAHGATPDQPEGTAGALLAAASQGHVACVRALLCFSVGLFGLARTR